MTLNSQKEGILQEFGVCLVSHTAGFGFDFFLKKHHGRSKASSSWIERAEVMGTWTVGR